MNKFLLIKSGSKIQNLSKAFQAFSIRSRKEVALRFTVSLSSMIKTPISNNMVLVYSIFHIVYIDLY